MGGPQSTHVWAALTRISMSFKKRKKEKTKLGGGCAEDGVGIEMIIFCGSDVWSSQEILRATLNPSMQAAAAFVYTV